MSEERQREHKNNEHWWHAQIPLCVCALLIANLEKLWYRIFVLEVEYYITWNVMSLSRFRFSLASKMVKSDVKKTPLIEWIDGAKVFSKSSYSICSSYGCLLWIEFHDYFGHLIILGTFMLLFNSVVLCSLPQSSLYFICILCGLPPQPRISAFISHLCVNSLATPSAEFFPCLSHPHFSPHTIIKINSFVQAFPFPTTFFFNVLSSWKVSLQVRVCSHFSSALFAFKKREHLLSAYLIF